MAREKEKEWTDKSHPHHHPNVKCLAQKRGPPKRGKTLPRPARRGRDHSPGSSSPFGLARGTTSVFQQQTGTLKRTMVWHLSPLPGPDRRRQKTSRRLPAIGLVLLNSPRDGRTGDPSCAGCAELAGVVWGGGGGGVGMPTYCFHLERVLVSMGQPLPLG